MSEKNSEHIAIVLAGIIFIAGFVLLLVSQGGGREDSVIGRAVSATGMATYNIQPLSCTENNPADVPPTPKVKGSLTFTYNDLSANMQSIITREDTCATNSLGGAGYVAEYFCKTSTLPAVSLLPCGPGESCADGACTGGLVCTDTDGGIVYESYGETNGWDSFAHQYRTYQDSCLTDDELIENYCINTGELGDERAVCEHGCSEGICMDPAQGGSAGSCADADGGINAVVAGTVMGPSESPYITTPFTDTCTQADLGNGQIASILIEGYCTSDGKVSNIRINCQNGCTGGACNAVNGATGCADSDGGLDYAVAGTVMGMHYGLNGWSFTDKCYTATSGKEYVQEGYCKNGEALYENHLCEGGCLGGVCLEYSNEMYNCTDSDGGQNFFVLGTTIGMHEGNPSWTHVDRCYGDYVVEGYCGSNGEVHTLNYLCNNGCANGVCIIIGPTKTEVSNSADSSSASAVSSEATDEGKTTQAAGGNYITCPPGIASCNSYGTCCGFNNCATTCQRYGAILCCMTASGSNTNAPSTGNNSNSTNSTNVSSLSASSWGTSGTTTQAAGTSGTTTQAAGGGTPSPSVPTVGNNTTVNVTANCIDTDGGINAYVAGYAYVYSSGGVYSAVYDSCYSTTTLKEAYCSSNIPVSGLLTCGANYTCLVNRCVGVNTASATGSGGSSTAPKSTAG